MESNPTLPYKGEQQQAGQISPTPSPAGSEGSNCSKVGKYHVRLS